MKIKFKDPIRNKRISIEIQGGETIGWLMHQIYMIDMYKPKYDNYAIRGLVIPSGDKDLADLKYLKKPVIDFFVASTENIYFFTPRARPFTPKNPKDKYEIVSKKKIKKLLKLLKLNQIKMLKI